VVVSDLLPELIRREYDASVLTDPTKTRDLARLYPDAIVFVNIDEGQPEPEWAALVETLLADPETSGLILGVFTAHQDPEIGHKYLLELAVPAGIVRLTRNYEEVLQAVVQTLEVHEARGRRQYLRVPCREGDTSLNLVHEGKPLRGTIADVSSVGMACWFDRDPGWVAHTQVKGIQLKLRGLLCTVTVVIMGTRPRSEGCPLYVMLFDPHTGDDVKEKIRTFQKKELQALLDEALDHQATAG